MLNYLMEDLYKDIIPLLEKVPEDERENAEKLTAAVQARIANSNNAFDVNIWYRSTVDIRDEVGRFENHPDVYVADFGAKIKWILTKAPYFYSDD